MPSRDTSQRALHDAQLKAPALRERVYQAIRQRGGLTCAEVERHFGTSHQTISARIHELHRAGRIEDSGLRRLTPLRKPAIVWRVAIPVAPRVEAVRQERLF